ncbi:hypothetical protein [Algibacter pacificus]|uniref:hypothetical protein n=1 Tax=Algibacter pacificus TaxID=2599389 RepID=UPI0011CB70EE|nr:hypothetical protein [Algibacter pacificus]
MMYLNLSFKKLNRVICSSDNLIRLSTKEEALKANYKNTSKKKFQKELISLLESFEITNIIEYPFSKFRNSVRFKKSDDANYSLKS